MKNSWASRLGCGYRHHQQGARGSRTQLIVHRAQFNLHPFSSNHHPNPHTLAHTAAHIHTSYDSPMWQWEPGRESDVILLEGQTISGCWRKAWHTQQLKEDGKADGGKAAERWALFECLITTKKRGVGERMSSIMWHTTCFGFISLCLSSFVPVNTKLKLQLAKCHIYKDKWKQLDKLAFYSLWAYRFPFIYTYVCLRARVSYISIFIQRLNILTTLMAF